MLRSFAGALAALAVMRALAADEWSRAVLLVLGVGLVALLELALGGVRRKLMAPKPPRRGEP